MKWETSPNLGNVLPEFFVFHDEYIMMCLYFREGGKLGDKLMNLRWDLAKTRWVNTKFSSYRLWHGSYVGLKLCRLGVSPTLWSRPVLCCLASGVKRGHRARTSCIKDNWEAVWGTFTIPEKWGHRDKIMTGKRIFHRSFDYISGKQIID